MDSTQYYVSYDKANIRQETHCHLCFGSPAWLAKHGKGVFTSFLCREYQHGKIGVIGLEHHLSRLLDNAKEENLLQETNPLHTSSSLKQVLASEVSAIINSQELPTPLRARLVIDQSAVLRVFLESYQALWPAGKAVAIMPVNLERKLTAIKSSDIRLNQQAYQLAKSAGADEALLVDSNGFIREGAWSNIFWFNSSGELFTTKNNVLPGITRKLILENKDCKEVDIKYADFLTTAKQAFLTQSTSGITAIAKIDDYELKLSRDGRIDSLRDLIDKKIATDSECLYELQNA